MYFLLFYTIIKIFENIGNYKDILLLIYLILSAKCSVATWIVKSVSDSKLLLQTLHKLLAEDLSEVVLLVEKFCSSMGSFLISLSLTTKSSFSILIWPTPETNSQINFLWIRKEQAEKARILRLLTEKIFRQINSLVISIVNTLPWRNFCRKCVRVNFHNFQTVNDKLKFAKNTKKKRKFVNLTENCLQIHWGQFFVNFTKFLLDF